MEAQHGIDYDLDLIRRQTLGLVDTVATRPGSTKLLIGVARELVRAIVELPEDQARAILLRVVPGIRLYARYKVRAAR